MSNETDNQLDYEALKGILDRMDAGEAPSLDEAKLLAATANYFMVNATEALKLTLAVSGALGPELYKGEPILAKAKRIYARSLGERFA